MTLGEFLYNLTEEYCTAEFVYKGKQCGIEPEVNDSIVTYSMWYDKKWKEFKNINELITDIFFEGKTLIEILPLVDVYFL